MHGETLKDGQQFGYRSKSNVISQNDSAHRGGERDCSTSECDFSKIWFA